MILLTLIFILISIYINSLVYNINKKIIFLNKYSFIIIINFLTDIIKIQYQCLLWVDNK